MIIIHYKQNVILDINKSKNEYLFKNTNTLKEQKDIVVQSIENYENE